MNTTMPSKKPAMLEYILDEWGCCKGRDQVDSVDVYGSDILNHTIPYSTIVPLG
jgi:hypothetical protein